jgi:hypothetical protein
MRTDAAECELDGPRITGPTTSLKMLGGSVAGMAERVCGVRGEAAGRRRARSQR